MGVTVLGIRHHSPACAGLVRHTIEGLRPGLVLIEGPVDMNDRIDELRLPHQLPIALYTYRADGPRTESCWSPFCAHSPEWAAIDAAAALAIPVKFFDLPGWHPAFWGVRNRYADRHDRVARVAATLCARFGVSDVDALWDHLFEQPMPHAQLQQRLAAYFEELRADDAADERDAPREAFMIECLQAARTVATDVVVVCGGWHAPVLQRALAKPRAVAAWPAMPAAPEGSRVGSYLVPYSFHRLDSFTGYESGMPSPAFQDATLRLGPARAAETMLGDAIARLRRRRQPVSAADLIAVQAMAEGLSRLRGHEAISRIDLLDGLAAALVKDALDAPLPWTYRGPIRPRTDPVLVEVVAAFTGDRVGTLAEATPRPPLLIDVVAQLEAHDLAPARTARRVTLDLTRVTDRQRSRILHRLRVLETPGFARISGPRWPTDASAPEVWAIEDRLEAQGTLIEAAVYGATLEAAATGRVEEALIAANGRLGQVALMLVEAAFIGIDALAARVFTDVAGAIAAEPSLDELGDALAILLGLWRYDVLLGTAGTPVLGDVITAAFARGLWLVEGIQGPRTPANLGHVHAVLALRDTLLHGGSRLALDAGVAHAVMQRRQHDTQAPASMRGAALGFLWSTDFFADAATGGIEGTRAMRRSARPDTLGDFLAGLFVIAREQTMNARGLIEALDAVFGDMAPADFAAALPSLRLAFSFFPPAEKERIARAIAALRGGAEADARQLLRTAVAPDIMARAMALEADVTAVARRYGLDSGEER